MYRSIARHAPRVLALRVSLLIACAGLVGCRPATAPTDTPDVLVVETFLADIVCNVAGEHLLVEALMPLGADPHSFEPTPQDVARVASSSALVVNGAGFESFLEKLLEQANGDQLVIEAAAGLHVRQAKAGEPEEHEQEEELGEEHTDEEAHSHAEGDPHFWLDPLMTVQYVENIRAGLSQLDPEHAQDYQANAEAYTKKLRELDAWITQQVASIPAERRLLVTNHESFGYFADHYGFKVVGTVIPGVSTGSSPSAQEMAALIDHIREAGAPAIFLETGSNPQLAQQIAQETYIKVVSDLYTHSITEADGPAPTYLDMMRYNVTQIVAALQP